MDVKISSTINADKETYLRVWKFTVLYSGKRLEMVLLRSVHKSFFGEPKWFYAIVVKPYTLRKKNVQKQSPFQKVNFCPF